MPRERQIASLGGYVSRRYLFPCYNISRSYVFQLSTWPFVSTRRVDSDVHLYAPTFEGNPSNPIRISRACHAHVKSGWYLRIAAIPAKSTLSHTPILSLNCFGKALIYRKRELKSWKRSGQDTLSFLCVHPWHAEYLWGIHFLLTNTLREKYLIFVAVITYYYNNIIIINDYYYYNINNNDNLE